MPTKAKELTREEVARARVIAQFGKMPYGGICHFQGLVPDITARRAYSETQFLDIVADNLDKLRTTLERISRDATNAETELAQYKEAAAGLRFLLGIKKEKA